MPMFNASEVSKYDIGLYLNKNINSNQLYDIIENLWKPDDKFIFPITMEGNGDTKSKGRKRFVKNWFKEHSWLVYSKLYDSAFCYPCMFFGHSTGHNTFQIAFWTSASGKLSQPQTKYDIHKAAVAAMENFRSVKHGEIQSINIQLDQQRKAIINKKMTKTITNQNCR